MLKTRAAHGVFLMMAANLGTMNWWVSPADCRKRAEEFLHSFHGKNPLSMVYLTNMAALGGEHSSWQLYHGWFGASGISSSALNYIGKPSAVVEPDYPYYKGTDNHGVSDNKSSLYGPAPGCVPGGPNPYYGSSSSDCPGGGTATPLSTRAPSTSTTATGMTRRCGRRARGGSTRTRSPTRLPTSHSARTSCSDRGQESSSWPQRWRASSRVRAFSGT